jgi:hypothetical protein
MKRLLTSLLLFLSILTISCSRANVGGKWSGQFKAADSTRAEPALLVLTEAGNILTGTAGPDATHQWAIKNGKVDGGSISFDVTSNTEITIHFTLKLVDKLLKGEAKGQAGADAHIAAVDLTRTD